MVVRREKIGNRMRRIRKDLGITMEELSERSGVSRNTLGKIEAGGGVTLDTIGRIEKVLGVMLLDVEI